MAATANPEVARLAVPTVENERALVEQEIARTEEYFGQPRFDEITRLYSIRQVVAQRGTINKDYTVARDAAIAFYARLRELFASKKSITTFGPYTPGQAVAMKRTGIEGIYLGGWATSAKGSINEDPGPDLASYPLSQVPDEAAPIVRALLTADRNQKFARGRMTDAERADTPIYDYRPFIIADADTGHGGEAHVFNLIRRFVEVGVPGYHIEDQKPGVKKCGHQGGKVLIPQNEQIKRLNSARFQLDIMEVPGIIVARTDSEAATYLDGSGDERDQPYLLGATKTDLPAYKDAYLAILKRFYDNGVEEINGHLLYAFPEDVYEGVLAWLESVEVLPLLDESARNYKNGEESNIETVLDAVMDKFLEAWHLEAGLKTYGEAAADVMQFRAGEGAKFEMTIDEWTAFAKTASSRQAEDKAISMGLNVPWDCEIARTPEGYYQIKGGIEYAVWKSLAVAPFCDLLWMETKTANLPDAKVFAEAIHAVYPDKMLAYNLSPSFNWDTTGMTEEEMRNFPEEIGKLGYVFNFITYGGHQVDGMASEEFSTALIEDGMLALARLQRKLRLTNSPYKTPQAHVGGPRLDGALMASSGRTAATKAMGKGSTQFQHLVQTEVPTTLLDSWLDIWSHHNNMGDGLRAKIRPHTAGSDLLALTVRNGAKEKVANVVFSTIHDRRNRSILSIRDQNTFDTDYRKKRLMTLVHLFLIHRYKAVSVHYVSPNDDNNHQTQGMKKLGIFDEVNTEIGDIIVAHVNSGVIDGLAYDEDRTALEKLIRKEK
ncbi:MAG: isocitrate lyase family protein [Candidatus Hydrogenedentes bacterium]|nr:isocitrate lyase family protein [Candidatus Hydrogenedentota bacterium]